MFRPSFALITLLAWTLVACSARRRAESTILRDLTFEGTRNLPFSPHNGSSLRAHMTQRQSPPGVVGPFSFLARPAVLDEAKLEWDRTALEVHLAHEGWLQATVDRWEIRQRRKTRRRKAAVVDVVGHVTLGEPTLWDADSPVIAWEGPALAPRPVLEKLIAVRPGKRARLADVEAAEADLGTWLLEHGHALGTVRATIAVRGQRARLTLAIAPGEPHTLGPVTVEGAHSTDPTRVRELVAAREGRPWDADITRDTADRLLATGAFRQVRVTPDPRERGPRLPVVVQVEEGLPRRLSLAGSFGYEGPFLVPRGEAQWSHDNVGGQLHRIELTGSFGAALSPLGDAIPVLALGVERQTQRFVGLPVQWTSSTRVGLDLFEGLVPQLLFELGTEWRRRITRDVTVLGGVDAGVRGFFDFVEYDESYEVAALGLGTESPYRFVAPRVELRWAPLHRRDTRRHGLDVRLSARHAWVSGPDVTRLELYGAGTIAPQRPFLGRPVQLGLRGRVSHLLGADPIPWPERLFLGGTSSLRSFRAAAVGPYDSVCLQRPVYGLRQLYLPRGGRTAAFGTAEIELHRVLARDLALVGFAESGVLDGRVRYGAGGGVRYETPLGPLRVDLGVRPLFPEDYGPRFGVASSEDGIYIGCGAPRRRAFDVFSEFTRFRDVTRDGPAFNLMFSLGLP